MQTSNGKYNVFSVNTYLLQYYLQVNLCFVNAGQSNGFI